MRTEWAKTAHFQYTISTIDTTVQDTSLTYRRRTRATRCITPFHCK